MSITSLKRQGGNGSQWKIEINMNDEKLKEIKNLIEKHASAFDLAPSVIYGIIMTESAMIPEAIRYEENYRWLFSPDKVKPRTCSAATETELQKMSWGLMQCMGAVYREHGYEGWLTGITQDIDCQIYYGCKHFKRFVTIYKSTNAAISAYNTGSPRKDKTGKYLNQQYVDKVLTNAGMWNR